MNDKLYRQFAEDLVNAIENGDVRRDDAVATLEQLANDLDNRELYL